MISRLTSNQATRVSLTRVAGAAAVVLAALSTALVAAEPAHAAVTTCKQWRVSPVFEAVQDNGYTVRFSLRQSGNRLYGSAAALLPNTDWAGRTRTSVTYGLVGGNGGPGYSFIGGSGGSRVFLARVRWSNDVIGNYSGSPWYIQRTRTGSLWAELRGFTYDEAGGRSSSWRTYSPTGSAKPIVCFAADVIG